MRLINKDRLQSSLVKKEWEPGTGSFADGFNDCLKRVKSMVHSQPVVDAVPVVRCKDCRYRNTKNCAMYLVCGWCGGQWEWTTDDGFCNYGAPIYRR